jgi:hypothetical protein
MNNKIPQEIEEVNKRFKDIMDKKLNNNFISAGSLIRFRDACFKAGQKQKEEDVLKLIDDWALSSILSFDDDSIKQKKIIDDITKYVKELKSKLTGGKDGKEDSNSFMF